MLEKEESTGRTDVSPGMSGIEDQRRFERWQQRRRDRLWTGYAEMTTDRAGPQNRRRRRLQAFQAAAKEYKRGTGRASLCTKSPLRRQLKNV